MENNELPTGKWVEIMFAMVVVMFSLMMCGCCRKVVERIEVEYRDSIVERTILDTVNVPVYIEIPSQVAERITPEDSSHLENDYAVSEAKVDSLGLLHHLLWTKPQKIETEVEVVTPQTHHEEFHSEKDKEKIYVQVPRDYTWWDQTRFYISYAAILAILAFVIWKLSKWGRGIEN